MKEIRKNPIFLALSLVIIFIAGILIILSLYEINNTQTIIDNQREIIDENRQWAEKITFWEVTGGLGEDIIEGEKVYYEALAKYSAALQAQSIAKFFIIILSIIIILTVGILIVKII